MAFARRYAAHRYRVLFATLLVSLAVLPVTRPLGLGEGVAEFFLGANLLAGVIAIGEDTTRGVVLVVLGLALVARTAAGALEHAAIADLSLAVWGIVALAAAAQALRFALRGVEVGAEKVCAALS